MTSEEGAYLLDPRRACPSGQHVEALRLPLYKWMIDQGVQFACGCKHPKREA